MVKARCVTTASQSNVVFANPRSVSAAQEIRECGCVRVCATGRRRHETVQLVMWPATVAQGAAAPAGRALPHSARSLHFGEGNASAPSQAPPSGLSGPASQGQHRIDVDLSIDTNVFIPI